jgi:hypothetical protein
MASFQEQLDELNQKIEAWFNDVKEYFLQLNEYEKYGWAAEGTGFILIIVGIVLFFF